MRLYYPTYPGRFTVSVGTRGPTVALGPASNEGDLVTPLRAVAADYKFMSEPKEADGMTTFTIAISSGSRRDGPQCEAVKRLADVFKDTQATLTHLDISWAPIVTPSTPRDRDFAASGASGLLSILKIRSVRHLRSAQLYPVNNLPAVRTVTLTKHTGHGELVRNVTNLLENRPSILRICFREEHCLVACTCWDDIAEGTFIHKRGTARSKKATVPRDALVANRRATRASMVPALNVLATAEHARKLPTEIWHMVWGFLPGDGMSAAQAARAVELGWGDGAATLSKRAATFGHLDGAEFGAALDQWLVSEGF